MSRQEWPKRCGCGREHDRAAWAELPFVGVFEDSVVTEDHPEAETLEMRNCACGSTITVKS